MPCFREDDVAAEIKALSLQSKDNLNESEEEETIVVPVKKKVGACHLMY